MTTRTPKYEVHTTAEYRRCRKRVKKRGLRLEILDEVIEMLAADEPLPVSKKDHLLSGDWQGYRECHVADDWLLIYQKKRRELVLVLMRTGTHAEVFKNPKI